MSLARLSGLLSFRNALASSDRRQRADHVQVHPPQEDPVGAPIGRLDLQLLPLSEDELVDLPLGSRRLEDVERGAVVVRACVGIPLRVWGTRYRPVLRYGVASCAARRFCSRARPSRRFLRPGPRGVSPVPARWKGASTRLSPPPGRPPPCPEAAWRLTTTSSSSACFRVHLVGRVAGSTCIRTPVPDCGTSTPAAGSGTLAGAGATCPAAMAGCWGNRPGTWPAFHHWGQEA